MSISMLFSVPHENNVPLSKCKLFVDSHGIGVFQTTKNPLCNNICQTCLECRTVSDAEKKLCTDYYPGTNMFLRTAVGNLCWPINQRDRA